MATPRTGLTRRLIAALDATPSRIPVIVGPTGSGRTTVVQQLRDRLGRTAAQYVDVERTATTPERFYRALTTTAPFSRGTSDTVSVGARGAFEAALAFLSGARTDTGQPVTFILDEFLELRTFESFPGLRRVLVELMDGLAASPNRFVLTSRYTARTLRALRDRSPRYELIAMPPLTPEETLDLIAAAAPTDAHEADALARTVQALADGRPAYVRAIADELVAMREHGSAGDPVSSLSALLAPDGRLTRDCSFCYELRLHRARGYGALKAILEILAEQEPLTLTEISQRLQRTPGSTKDYLSWLEDVDLVAAHQKRYSFSDPLLRTWVRLYCRTTAPSEDDIAREVHRYALPRLPQGEPALAMAGAGAPAGPRPQGDEEKRAWGIIEID